MQDCLSVLTTQKHEASLSGSEGEGLSPSKESSGMHSPVLSYRSSIDFPDKPLQTICSEIDKVILDRLIEENELFRCRIASLQEELESSSKVPPEERVAEAEGLADTLSLHQLGEDIEHAAQLLFNPCSLRVADQQHAWAAEQQSLQCALLREGHRLIKDNPLFSKKEKNFRHSGISEFSVEKELAHLYSQSEDIHIRQMDSSIRLWRTLCFTLKVLSVAMDNRFGARQGV